MVFQQKLLEKASLIVKMIGPVMVWPASSYFWKTVHLTTASLRSKRFLASSSRKLGREQIKEWLETLATQAILQRMLLAT